MSSIGTLTPLPHDVFCCVMLFLPPENIISLSPGNTFVPGPVLRTCRLTYNTFVNSHEFWQALLPPPQQQQGWGARISPKLERFGTLYCARWERLGCSNADVVRRCVTKPLTPNSVRVGVLPQSKSDWDDDDISVLVLQSVDLNDCSSPVTVKVLPPKGAFIIDMERVLIGVTSKSSWNGEKSDIEGNESVYLSCTWGQLAMNVPGPSASLDDECGSIELKVNRVTKTLRISVDSAPNLVGDVSYALLEKHCKSGVRVFVGLWGSDVVLSHSISN
eukprot:PhF_6_TR26347/c0_g1_i14/m.37925